MKRTQKTVDFGDFEPTIQAPAHQPIARDAFRGQPPEVVAKALADAHAQRVTLRPGTRDQKEMVTRLVLEALRAKGHDVSTADSATMSAYREWLRARVEAGDISESYAGHIAIQWNATVRCVFGKEAGQPLCFKGFRQHERKIVRRSADDMAALLAAAHHIGHGSQDDKEAFLIYLELAWPTGGRGSSILVEDLTFADVDWQKGTLVFERVKNKPVHEVVLSERAVAKLRERRAYCMTRPWWRGEETPIAAGRRGDPVCLQTVNNKLKKAAVRAGITDPLTSHVVRKSAGTLMARQNPRYAREQLGITAKVFEKHYNQPTIEDRLERRDLVPTVAEGPDAAIGRAFMDLQAQRINQAQFQDIVERANKMRIAPRPVRDESDRAYL